MARACYAQAETAKASRGKVAALSANVPVLPVTDNVQGSMSAPANIAFKKSTVSILSFDCHNAKIEHYFGFSFSCSLEREELVRVESSRDFDGTE